MLGVSGQGDGWWFATILTNGFAHGNRAALMFSPPPHLSFPSATLPAGMGEVYLALDDELWRLDSLPRRLRSTPQTAAEVDALVDDVETYLVRSRVPIFKMAGSPSPVLVCSDSVYRVDEMDCLIIFLRGAHIVARWRLRRRYAPRIRKLGRRWFKRGWSTWRIPEITAAEIRRMQEEAAKIERLLS